MKINTQNISAEAQTYVRATQLHLFSELGESVSTTQVLNGIVLGHANLTTGLGVDAALFCAALESLIDQGEGHIVALWVQALGGATGYWATKSPDPETTPATSYSEALRAKADEIDAQAHNSSDS